jgi:Porin PorA
MVPESPLNTNASASRWRAIRNLKSNLALVIIGCLLVLLAACWRLAIAPALKIVATDMEMTYFYDTTLTSYANPPGRPAASAQPVQARTNRAILSLPLQSTGSTALFKVETELVNKESLQPLSSSTHVYALDRETGEMVASKKADRARSGYYLVFPFNTPKSSVPFWSELTGKTYPANFRNEKMLFDVNTYVFSTGYKNQKTSQPPEGYPRSLSGTELKAMLSMPDLPLGDTETVTPTYRASGTTELTVEPRAGTIVRTDGTESVTIAVKGPGSRTVVEAPLFKLEYSQTDGSVFDAAQLARDEAAKIQLQFLYIPLGLLALGIAVFLIGAFAGVKRGYDD